MVQMISDYEEPFLSSTKSIDGVALTALSTMLMEWHNNVDARGCCIHAIVWWATKLELERFILNSLNTSLENTFFGILWVVSLDVNQMQILRPDTNVKCTGNEHMQKVLVVMIHT